MSEIDQKPNALSDTENTSSGRLDSTSALLDLAIVFSPILILFAVARSLSLNDPFSLIIAIWCSYIVMLILIAVVLRYRAQCWTSIGLEFRSFTTREAGKAVLKSIVVFVFAMVAFIFGAIVMANIVGVPEPADMSRYNYLSGNVPMLIVSLIGVYIVSSFGEEVVFRGFLISRLKSVFGGEGRSSTILALVVSSVLFGVAHLEWGLTGIVQTTFMGAALGISFVLNKYGLWPLVIAHGYLDTILIVQMYLA